MEEDKKKIAKTIGEVEFNVVKALDKSYQIEKYDILGRGGLTVSWLKIYKNPLNPFPHTTYLQCGKKE